MNKLYELAPKLEKLKPEELLEALKSLEALVVKAKECITTAQETTTTATTTVSKPPGKSKTTTDVTGDLFTLLQQPDINKTILQDTSEFLDTVGFYPNPTNRNTPEICLFGDQRYCYNAHSAAVPPTPIEEGGVMNLLLDAVNEIQGTKYNSMLVNRYRSRNVFLGVHKDDESCLVKEAPISTLSFGCTRRMKIAPDGDKHKLACQLFLSPGSLLTMMPGFQEKYWHSIPEGRKSLKSERGLRYSVTFRQLKVAQPSLQTANTLPAAKEPVPVVEMQSSPTTSTTPAAIVCDGNTPDTFVFGSSLLKGLDEQNLSKYAKNFKVFCNRGAAVRDIYEDVEKVRDRREYDTTKVTSVFLLCGGNDVESLGKGGNIHFLFEDMEDLVDLVKEVFPNALVNFISLIPRKAMYLEHIRNMHKVNDWLSVFCRKNSVRFVDIFSFFVNKTPSGWWLNLKLFNRSKLHFSLTGDSIIAKVCIGVANSPRS